MSSCRSLARTILRCRHLIMLMCSAFAGGARRYCSPEGNETQIYPFNPNGSPEGIAALCSPNGRHLAIMPHPERSFLAWQQPWVPPSLGLAADGPAPWLRLFQNARSWAENVKAL